MLMLRRWLRLRLRFRFRIKTLSCGALRFVVCCVVCCVVVALCV